MYISCQRSFLNTFTGFVVRRWCLLLGSTKVGPVVERSVNLFHEQTRIVVSTGIVFGANENEKKTDRKFCGIRGSLQPMPIKDLRTKRA